MSKSCVHCGLINPDTSSQCDCGMYFSGSQNINAVNHINIIKRSILSLNLFVFSTIIFIATLLLSYIYMIKKFQNKQILYGPSFDSHGYVLVFDSLPTAFLISITTTAVIIFIVSIIRCIIPLYFIADTTKSR